MNLEEAVMNKKPVTEDSGRSSDWGSHAQTDKPWKGNPEKEQRSKDEQPDLEKWHESNTQ
ncbi:hypothetical protein [Bradyrhizobium erythrophlei]|uniref:Uncharacterized protein n=1 Tax=Bradyrhizobium erythrophlei TaxID=1437360 RepID=A0A1H4Y4T0_9BRAD|nr:hypothetical protein [Bradyrhizobium erythrophlei]SED12735.1 hypothetical protein SAMN05444164_3779 [Bradyrhizobium erythrophlei]